MKLLKELSEAFGPTGYESEIGSVLAEAMEKCGFIVKTDSLGSVICHKEGTGKRLMLSAFMDEPGFIVTDADGKGILSMRGEGLGEGECAAVRFASGACALMKNEKGKLMADAGEQTKEDALKSYPIGTYAVFDEPCRCRGDFAVGKALSSRAGAAALLLASTEISTERDLYVVFAAQHLSDSRGAQAAACIEPDEILCLGSVEGRGGVFFSAMEKGFVADEGIKRAILEIDPSLKISVTDTKDSDAPALSRLGARTGAVLIGVGEKGAATESLLTADILRAARTVKKFAERI